MGNIKTVEELDGKLADYYGTECYHKLSLGNLKCTDGIKALAEEAGAFWFVDIIASYQGEAKVKACPFQVWRVHSEEGNSFVDMREDSDTPVIVRQELPCTDFPKGEYEVYCIDGVALLKSEY